jgi:hypothetical protein
VINNTYNVLGVSEKQSEPRCTEFQSQVSLGLLSTALRTSAFEGAPFGRTASSNSSAKVGSRSGPSRYDSDFCKGLMLELPDIHCRRAF